jgi:TonB family protein
MAAVIGSTVREMVPIPESALPPPVEGIVGGVQAEVKGGVVAGVVGGVAAGAAPPVVAYRNGAAVMGRRVRSIRIQGLPEQASAELLASLPIHEGDEFSADTLQRAVQAARAFDEHLIVRLGVAGTPGQPAQSPVDVDVIISVPGTAGGPLFTLSAPPPPPPPPGSSASSAPPERIKVGSNVQAMMILNKVAPIYPELAKSARVSGVVQLAAVIAKDGTVQEMHLLGGPALLIQAAMDAVKQWVYRPTLLNGEPVSVETTVDVNFTLNQ